MKERDRLFFRISVPLVLGVLLLLSGRDASASPPQKPQKRILLLYGQDREHPAHELTDKGIRSVVTSDQNFDIELYPEYMDLSRFQEPGYKEILTRFLGDKYSAVKPDLVITMYPSALSFVLNYCDHAFPGIPIVACTIFESSARELEQTGERARTTGVIFKGDIGDIVPIARALRPAMRRIALVGGTSELDKIILATVRNALKQYETVIEVWDIAGLAMPQTIERVSSLPSDCIILYSSILIDGQGQHFVPRQALSTISRAANVPVFSLSDSYLGYGIVGGCLLSFEAQGKKAAELAIRILAGESPGDIPFSEYDTIVNMFDWRELRRWGISETSLPAGSIVKYREDSVWDKYRGRIIGAVALFVLQAVLIVALVLNLRKARRIGKELSASEMRYRTVADYTYDWEYWLALDGTVNYISPSCEDITGFMPRQFINNPGLFREIVVPEDREVWEKHEHTRRTGEKLQETYYRIRRLDGEIRWIEHVCRPVVGDQGEFLGIRGSNRDITARKQVEEAILEGEKDLQRLATRLISAHEEERRSLARELHDDLSQRLAALAIQAGRMERQARDGQELIAEECRDLKDQAIEISAGVHSLSRQLHPSILDDLGLTKAVESECTRFSKREGIEVAFAVENIPDSIPKDVSLSIYRIIQEGLNNIAKHACACHATVSLRGVDHGLSLSVKDDGIGFDKAEVRKKPGLGLSSMRERVRIIQGELRIKSEAEKGTTIEVNVPLKEGHSMLRSGSC